MDENAGGGVQAGRQAGRHMVKAPPRRRRMEELPGRLRLREAREGL